MTSRHYPTALRRPAIACILSCAVCMPPHIAVAQTDSAAPPTSATAETLAPAEYYRLLQQARSAMAANQFADALPLLRRLTAQHPDDGELWMQLGRCLRSTKQPAEAVLALERAYELGWGFQAQLAVETAGLHASLGRREEALAWLDRALADRLTNRALVRVQGNWQKLLSDPEVRGRIGMVDAIPTERVAGWQGDLDLLLAEAQRLHPQIDHRTPRAEWESAAAALRERVAELSDEQMLFELRRLVARIGDGHTNVWFENKRVEVRQLPLRFYAFVEGVFIIDAAPELTDLIGAQVLRVGETPVEEARRRMEVFACSDNPMGALSQSTGFLCFVQALETVGLATPGQTPRLEILDRHGVRRTIEPQPRAMTRRGNLPASKIPGAPPPPLWLRRPEQNVWMQRLDAPGTLYVQFNGVGNQRDHTLEQAAQELRAEWTSGDVRNIVLDLRHNGGGDTFLYLPLLKTLIHFEQAAEDHRLLVLIGRWTFSAAQNFITDVDRLTEAVFFGEPSGGRPNSYGENSHVRLPYSGADVSISNQLWQHSYPFDHRQWIPPDIPAPPTAAAYFANRDPGLEAVLEVLADSQRQ